MVAALAGLARVISSYPATAVGERFVPGSTGQGNGVLTVLEALVASKMTCRVQMAVAAALLVFLNPLKRNQHEQQQHKQAEQPEQTNQQALFITVNMPALPTARASNSSACGNPTTTTTSNSNSSRRRRIARAYGAGASVSRAGAAAQGSGDDEGGGLQQQEQEEEEIKHEHQGEVGRPASSLRVAQRAIALLELDPPLTPPPRGSGSRAADGGGSSTRRSSTAAVGPTARPTSPTMRSASVT